MVQFLHEAYRGELFGIEFFKAFAENAEDKRERQKWQWLVELEVYTATLLKKWLEEEAGLSCAWKDPEMEAKGREIAQPWLSLEWQELMETLDPWIEGYAIKYREMAEGAAPGHYRISDMAAAHEEAILSFVQAERAGKADSMKAVNDFMENY